MRQSEKDPDAGQIEAMARKAIASLPEPFRSRASEVGLQIAELPTQAILRDLGIRDPLELTGLYEGIPLTEKSVFDQLEQPDMIWLFRRPILAEWHERGIDLQELVTHVMVHELAHHFGWSDDDIARIDRWWE